MEFKYEVKGITLGENEMRDIHQRYEILSTAEYILENWDFTEDEAMKLAYEVRRFMDKYDITESEALHRVVGNVKK